MPGEPDFAQEHSGFVQHILRSSATTPLVGIRELGAG